MAYPVVQGSASSTDADRSTTTFNLNLPAGIQAKETLLAFVSSRSGTDTVVFPAGWTVIWNEYSTSGDDLNASVAYRYADGTESGTIAVTVADLEAAGKVLRISGAANPSIHTPSVAHRVKQSTAIDSGGNDTTGGINNHGLLAGPWGNYDRYLGVVCLFYSDVVISYGEYPDNYSNFGDVNSGGGGFEVGLNVGHRDIQSIGEFFSRWRKNYTANMRSYAIGLVVHPEEAYAPPAAFPYINHAALSSDVQRSASTTYKLILPDTIVPGDVIIAVVATHDAIGDTVTWPSDWNELYDQTAGGGGNNMMSSAAWKKADGSEGRTITLTVDANPTCGVVFTVNNVPDPEPTLTDCFEWSATSGFNSVPGAGSITPAGGSDNYLWVGIYAMENDIEDYAGFPIDYDGRFVTKGDWGINSDDVVIAVCHSNDETARTSLTSNSMSLGTSYGWVAAQFVFKPGSFTDNWWYLGRYPSGRGGTM